mgnify:CR=1 FL=1
MAFTSTKLEENVFGNFRFTRGTFANDSGSTGGPIRTGLQQVQQVMLQPKGAVVAADHCVVNRSLPANAPITIVTGADICGYWFAIGY